MIILPEANSGADPRDGQFSVEQPDFAYNTERSRERQGNGLFTYGLLNALVTPQMPGSPSGRKQRDTDEIFRYVEDQVFDLNNPQSIAKRLDRSRSQRSCRRRSTSRAVRWNVAMFHSGWSCEPWISELEFRAAETFDSRRYS